MTNSEIILTIISTSTLLVVLQIYLKVANKSLSKKQKAVFVDTSVLMDGRILSIAKAGFLPSKLVIPRSVLAEMQFLADQGDSSKRERARSGLDVVHELKAVSKVSVEILNDSVRPQNGVDERLLELVRKYSGFLCTIDYNLIKVAQAESIEILNINELAQQLRMVHLPGEKVDIELTSRGSNSQQAVGHLDDGTMVVVEHAQSRLGSRVQVEIIRSIQTAAGKMMFARLIDSKTDSKLDTAKQGTKKQQVKDHNRSRKPLQKPAKKSPQVSGKRQTSEDRLINLVKSQE